MDLQQTSSLFCFVFVLHKMTGNAKGRAQSSIKWEDDPRILVIVDERVFIFASGHSEGEGFHL